jgi:hypothetical protein
MATVKFLYAKNDTSILSGLSEDNVSGPVDGDLLVCVTGALSQFGSETWAYAPGWTPQGTAIGGLAKSGICRYPRIAVASKVWRAGDSTDEWPITHGGLTPPGNAMHQRVLCIRNAQNVTQVSFATGLGFMDNTCADLVTPPDGPFIHTLPNAGGPLTLLQNCMAVAGLMRYGAVDSYSDTFDTSYWFGAGNTFGVPSSGYVARTAPIAMGNVFNGGDVGSTFDYRLAAFASFQLVVYETSSEIDPGGGGGGGSSPTDRLRVRAVPFDATHALTVNPLTRVSQRLGFPHKMREATRLQQDPTAVDALFLPRSTQNTEIARTYDGVTLLDLMDKSFPRRIVGRWNVEFITDEETGATLPDDTARSYIEYVLDRWSVEFPWFAYEPVPDLRYAVAGEAGVAAPSEYDVETSAGLASFGVVRTPGLLFPQSRDTRLSMLQILESLLSPFAGTVFFFNSLGRLQIVPAYGPDADETPSVVLDSNHVSSVSVGEPDASAIVNRASVASRGLRVTEFTPVMQPAWFQIGARDLFGVLEDDNEDRVWFEPAEARVNLQLSEDEDLVLQEELTPANAFADQVIAAWRMGDDSLFVGDAISLVDEAEDPLVTAAFRRYNLLGGTAFFAADGAGVLTLERDDVPTDGEWRRTIGWATTVGLVTFRLFLDARWNASAQTVELRVGAGSGDLSWNGGVGERLRLVVEFTLDDASTALAVSEGATVTFGVTGDELPNDSLTGSQTEFGVREETLRVEGYLLNPTDALAVAQGFVLARIEPRALRDVELGWLGSTQLRFDHRGREVMLPNESVGRIAGVSYADDFVSVTGGKSFRFEERIEGAVGDLTGLWLLNDDPTFWQSDDGDISEVA